MGFNAKQQSSRSTLNIDPDHAVGNMRFTNAATVLMLLTTIPQIQELPNGQQDILPPLLSFTAIATINHLWPAHIPWSTHFVKAAWSWLLFAMVAPCVAAGLAAYPSINDRVPTSPSIWTTIATANIVGTSIPVLLPPTAKKVGDAIELVNVLPRHSLMLLGFWFGSFSFLHAATCWVLLATYRYERAARIEAGMRYNYGLLHCLEHLQIILFVCGVTNIAVPLWSLALLFVIVGNLAPVVVWPIFNAWIYHRATTKPRPTWVHEALTPVFEKKLNANVFSLKWHQYFLKAWVGEVCIVFGSWAWMLRKAATLKPNPLKSTTAQAGRHLPAIGEFDMVIGLMTGGAFVACAVGHHYKIEHVTYVRSRLYSGLSMADAFNFVTLNLQLHKHNEVYDQVHRWNLNSTLTLRNCSNNSPLVPRPSRSLSKSCILLVDDTMYSGRSLSNAMTKLPKLLNIHPSQLHSAVLLAYPEPHRRYEPDYIAELGTIPVAWEWGVELD